MVQLFANSGDPDQILHFAASDLGLHCLPVTSLGVASLQWVKIFSQMQECRPRSDCSSALFAYAILSETLVYEILGHLTYA